MKLFTEFVAKANITEMVKEYREEAEYINRKRMALVKEEQHLRALEAELQTYHNLIKTINPQAFDFKEDDIPF